MIIAVASGKGGTGKTTVTSSLAWVWDRKVTAVDLDVEEPNLHLFLKPEILGREVATIEVPVADESKCTALPGLRRPVPVQSHQRPGLGAVDLSGNVPRLRRVHRRVP